MPHVFHKESFFFFLSFFQEIDRDRKQIQRIDREQWGRDSNRDVVDASALRDRARHRGTIWHFDRNQMSFRKKVIQDKSIQQRIGYIHTEFESRCQRAICHIRWYLKIPWWDINWFTCLALGLSRGLAWFGHKNSAIALATWSAFIALTLVHVRTKRKKKGRGVSNG